MKLLKPLLIVLILFLFNSCATTEDETIIDNKANFDAEYLVNSEEFTTISNLLNEAFNSKDLKLDKLLNLEANNEELFSLFSKKVFEETNFSELVKTGDVINNSLKPMQMGTNKTLSTRQRLMLTQKYAIANLINNRDYNRFGNDQRHARININHRQTEQSIIRQALLAQKEQLEVQDYYFNATMALLRKLERSALR